MEKIKTREVRRDIKCFDKFRSLEQHIKRPSAKIKNASIDDPAQQDSNPVNSAIRHVEQREKAFGHKIGYQTKKYSKNLLMHRKKEKLTTAEKRGVQGRKVKNAVKDSGQIVSTQKSGYVINVAGQAANKLAREHSKAVQVARATAKKAEKVARSSAAAMTAIIRAIMAATKNLVMAISACGSIATTVILIICMIGYVIGSVFGIFFSSGSSGGSPTMVEVIADINGEFAARVEQIQHQNPHDVVNIRNNGSSTIAGNWRDVLAIYAVKTAADPDEPMEVATLDSAKIQILRDIFWDMNEISFSVSQMSNLEQDTDIPTPDEGGTTSSNVTVLTIVVSSKTQADMRSVYHFNAEQNDLLDELLLPEYQELFMQLTGSYTNIQLSPEEIASIMENIPSNLSDQRKSAITHAYSLIGRVRYFWGGKSTVMGWDSRWGTPTKVTSAGSPTTGTIRPFGLDCSGYVTWIFCNVAGSADAVNVIRHGAANQYANCHKLSWNEAIPGDLAFFKGCSHVGIIIGKKANGNLLIAHCSSSKNDVVVSECSGPKDNGFLMVGRPYFYQE